MGGDSPERPEREIRSLDVVVESDGVTLPGFLDVPADADGMVIFAHGSGSSRLSPRNRSVARSLNEAGIATLLFDLLMPEEETDRTNVFDIPLLSERLELATSWVQARADVGSLEIGYFGASTGAGSALMAASELPEAVRAVVSRGGRPDLAGRTLQFIHAPTLLIVGGADAEVLALNSKAYDTLPGERRLAIVPHATHLFEEPGAMDMVIRLSIDWFTRYLVPA